MGEQLQREKELQAKEVEKLEAAAEACDNPAEIVREAAKTAEERHPRPASLWVLPYLIAAGVVGLALFILDWFPNLLSPVTAAKIQRYLMGIGAVILVLAAAKVIELYAISRLRNSVARFNLRRVLRLVSVLVITFIVISVLFVNWYAAVVSLGLISLVLGFALQNPISSFIGWIYILVRAPFRVGDRIEIGDARGDVIDVGYFDTTLWEIGGRHLSTDHPSGRIIKFPNTHIFSTAVINYSWPLFPYIWNEIKLNIAYESDLQFVGTTIQTIAEAELGEDMMQKVKIFRDLLARTPVDHLHVQERPSVIFRVSENTWIEAIVRYLVHPKEAGRVKADLTRKLLAALNAAPDRVLFPKSNMR